MSLRHISRTISFQTIYCLEFKDTLNIDIEEAKKEMINILSLLDLTKDDIEESYAISLIKNILDRRITIDEIIVRAAPDWPLDKIHSVDRNILRLGICELLFSDKTEVPMKVAINESIEIAKEYGSENSSRFVNGVMGNVYRELLEVGDLQKQEEMQKEIKESPVFEIKDMLGVLLYKTHNGQKYLGLIYDIFKHWGSCKSEIDKTKTLEENFVKIINKEFGVIDISQILNSETIGYTDFVTHSKDKNHKVKKNVNYYLVQVDDTVIPSDTPKDGIGKVAWIRIDDKLNALRFYPDFKVILNKAIEKVSWNR